MPATPSPADAPVELCYAVGKPCGCLVTIMTAWAYDNDPDFRREIAADVREGYTIERLSAEECRRRFRECEHGSLKEQIAAKAKVSHV